jgi:hypothetical protein
MVARRCRLIATFVTAALIAPMGVAEKAAADPPHWGGKHRGHGHGHHRHHSYRHHYAPYGAYLAPGIYLNLPPVVIAPPPLIVQQSAPRVRCRSWTGTVVIAGRAQPAYGTQCLMPDSTWQLVD